jgi:hypothetical protein
MSLGSDVNVNLLYFTMSLREVKHIHIIFTFQLFSCLEALQLHLYITNITAPGNDFSLSSSWKVKKMQLLSE